MIRRAFHRLALAACALAPLAAQALIVDVTVDGTDSVFLAGYTGAAPTALNAVHVRHPGGTPENVFETLPPMLTVAAGDVIRLLDPAIGGVNFFNGNGPPFFGPDGGNTSGSNLQSFGGISAYTGPTGPLAGVFLSDADPTGGVAPGSINFVGPGGVGLDFPSLSPALGQVFYIGDGQTGGGVMQTFIAPTGATRLFLGIPDGFGFVGAPGAYDDNDGAYRVRVGINEIPRIPEPTTVALLGIALLGIGARSRHSA